MRNPIFTFKVKFLSKRLELELNLIEFIVKFVVGHVLRFGFNINRVRDHSSKKKVAGDCLRERCPCLLNLLLLFGFCCIVLTACVQAADKK